MDVHTNASKVTIKGRKLMSRRACGLRVAAVMLTVLLGTFMAAVPAWAAPVSTALGGNSPAAHVNGAAVSDPVSGVSGDIQEQPCTSGRATWVHMTMNGTTRCFGYTGTLYFSGNNTTWFCAGNNYGTLKYWKNNTYYSLGFTNGTNVNLGGVDVTLLTINGWRGSNTC